MNDVTIFVLEPPDAVHVRRIVEVFLTATTWADEYAAAASPPRSILAARVFARSLLDWTEPHV